MSKITIVAKKAAFPGNLADEYLKLKADMADLKKQETALQNAILATGKDVIEGNFGRVTVSEIEGRYDTDYKAAALELLSRAKLDGFKKWINGSTRFNVRARKGDEEKAA